MIGKAATATDGDASSYISPSELASAIDAEYKANGWKTGVMLYQFSSDINGNIIKEITSPIANS